MSWFWVFTLASSFLALFILTVTYYGKRMLSLRYAIFWGLGSMGGLLASLLMRWVGPVAHASDMEVLGFLLLMGFLGLAWLGLHFSSILTTRRKNETRIAQDIALMKSEIEEIRMALREGDEESE